MHKNLNHYSEINAYQFVTFRTKDSIDDFLLRLNTLKYSSESKKQQAIDEYCDTSKAGRYLNGEIICCIKTYLISLEPEYLKLIALSVMPNHVHVLFVQNHDLAKTMQKIKGHLARLINKKLNKQGEFWTRNYYDTAIRDKRHFDTTYNYIKNNATKAKLTDAENRFYGIYE